MKNFEVALTKEMCFICRKTYDGNIVMNTVLSEKIAENVKSLHNKVTNYMDKPCDECKSKFEQDYIALITFDPSLSEMEPDNKLKFGNEYRVIPTCFIKKEALDKVIHDYEKFLIHKHALFIEKNVAEQIGLLEFYRENSEKRT